MVKGVVLGQRALNRDSAASTRGIMECISQHALLRGVASLKPCDVDYKYRYALPLASVGE